MASGGRVIRGGGGVMSSGRGVHDEKRWRSDDQQSSGGGVMRSGGCNCLLQDLLRMSSIIQTSSCRTPTLV